MPKALRSWDRRRSTPRGHKRSRISLAAHASGASGSQTNLSRAGPARRLLDPATLAIVPVLFVDLDNTLVDRAAAFAEFAHEFVVELHRDPTEAEWLIEIDNDGFAAREAVAAAIQERFGLSQDDRSQLLSTLRAGLVDRMRLDPEVPAALGRARNAGWRLAIVTNGTVPQQTRKITTLGLRPRVDAVVISEGVSVRKPDPAIFRYAAEAAGSTVAGGWMIGDSADADVAGAHAAGIGSIWLRRGRTWPSLGAPSPSHQADSFAEAVDLVLATGS